MKKAVITVLGNDKVGIIAKVCTFLAGKLQYFGYFTNHFGWIF